ncbi:trimeric intracellular cation channel type B [Tiliqua scincoides]|uniref:trimeric intracellular cation channel type B n=1 Tax=Tiliqua scincoides TaxID=71010 RepID=UPI003462E354
MEALLREMPLVFSRLPMFPFFDLAHYTASVMSLKEQRGAVEVAHNSPVACWFSAMLYCFGGSILSALMLAEPPVAFLANTTNVLLASSVWYLIFYCPHDLVYNFVSFLPMRLMVAGMKEVTRTWKITGGVSHAHSRYKNAWIVMIAVGWARGAGGGLISNFEQLVRGVWKPETNELLHMSCAVKTSLVGAVLFTMQHTLHLPIEKHNLMFFYTIFIVVKKVTMMLSGLTSSPFASLENPLASVLFGLKTTSSNVKDEAKVPSNNASSSCDYGTHEVTGESAKKRHPKKTE